MAGPNPNPRLQVRGYDQVFLRLNTPAPHSIRPSACPHPHQEGNPLSSSQSGGAWLLWPGFCQSQVLLPSPLSGDKPPEPGLALEPASHLSFLWDKTGQLSALIPGNNLICLRFLLPALLPSVRLLPSS